MRDFSPFSVQYEWEFFFQIICVLHTLVKGVLDVLMHVLGSFSGDG
jgi:hypothetical protein